MKRTQRIISLLLVISLLISGFNYNIVYSKEIQKDDEKNKGWEISNDNTLIISTFEVRDGNVINDGWKEIRNAVKKIYIKNAKIVDMTKELSEISTKTNVSFQSLFEKMENLEKVEIDGLDLDNVDRLSDMFFYNKKLTEVSIHWTLGKDTKYLDYMFGSCENLKKIDISDWNVSNVQKMNMMFSDCISLKKINLAKWNVKKDTDIGGMFDGCINLEDCTFAENWQTSGDDLCGCFLNMDEFTWNIGACSEQNFSAFYTELLLKWKKLMPSKYMKVIRQRYSQGWSMNHDESLHYCEIPPKIKPAGYEIETTRRDEYDLNKMRLIIYKNDNKINNIDDRTICANATVKSDKQTVKSDKYGNVTINNLSDGTISVSKNGYVTRKLTKNQLDVSNEIRIQKKSNDYPVISAVWVDKDYDVMNQYFYISSENSEKKQLQAEVDWGKSSYGSIFLIQGKISQKFDGNILTTSICNNFDINAPIYIVAKDIDGKSNKQELYFRGRENINIGFDMGEGQNKKHSDSDFSFLNGTEWSIGFFGDQVPVDFSIWDGKIKIVIGVEKEETYENEKEDEEKKDPLLDQENQKDDEENKEEDEENKEDDEVSKTIKAFKDIKEAVVRYKKDKKNANYDDLDTFKEIKSSKFGFGPQETYDAKICGYAEMELTKDGAKFLDGNIMIDVNGSVNLEHPFAVGPIPMFWRVFFSAEINAELNVINKSNSTTVKLSPSGKFSSKISADGSVGAGISDILYAKGGINGELLASYVFDSDFQNTDNNMGQLSDNIYANAVGDFSGYFEVGGFGKQFKKIIKECKPQFFPQKKEKSHFKANKKANNVNENTNIETFKSNVYKQSAPQLVSFEDGTKLSVWADGDEDDLNSITLYFSYYDGVSWSNPRQVYNDGTMDSCPVLKVIDDTAYLVWQNATDTINTNNDDADVTLEDGFGKVNIDFDISVAAFKKLSSNDEKGFSVTTIKNGNLDIMPKLCGQSDNIYVVWNNNGKNDYICNNNENTIYSSKISFNGNTVSYEKPKICYQNLNLVSSLTADYNNGLKIAYCMDTDGDITTDDVFIYENGKRVTQSKKAEFKPQYLEHLLYWYSDGKIASKNSKLTSKKVFSDKYSLIKIGNKTAAIYLYEKKLKNNMRISYLNEDDNVWEKPITLYNNEYIYDKYINDFSASVTNDGDINVLLNVSEVNKNYKYKEDEEPYGNADLEMISINKRCDIELNKVSYDAETFNRGEWMKCSFEVMNKGSVTVTGADVTLSDKSGNIVATNYIYSNILPGQITESYIYFKVNENANVENLVLTVIPDKETDEDITNNTKNIYLEYKNIAVENMTVGDCGNNTIISADISNRGYDTYKDITVSLVKDSLTGKVVEKKKIGAIPTFDQKTITFTTKTKNNDMYYVLLEQQDDQFKSDDYDCVKIIKSDETSKSSVKYKKMSIKKINIKNNYRNISGTVSVSNAKVTLKVGNCKVKNAVVNGKKFKLVLSKKPKKNTKVVITVTKTGYYTVKKTLKVK